MKSAPTPLLLGESPAMTAVRRFVERAAAVDVPLLVLGETGTGKSLLARVLHSRGPRAHGPFVAINCAAVPEPLFESELFGHRRGAFTGAHEDRPGLLESGHRGTLLLDEIGDLPRPQQAKLLTVLEEKEVRPVGARRPVKVDVRVLSATACPLGARVEDGGFRRDLFHRLALMTVRLPPLRERPGDVRRLAEHFLHAASARHRLPAPALGAGVLRALEEHPWPGNVRELAHALEAALILAAEDGFAAALEGVLRRAAAEGGADREGVPAAAGAHARGGAGPDGPRYSFYGTADEERDRIRDALARCRGNRSRAARTLGMSRNTLRDRMARYDL